MRIIQLFAIAASLAVSLACSSTSSVQNRQAQQDHIKARILSLSNGFTIQVPDGVCVTKKEFVDFDVYQLHLRASPDAVVARVYAGQAADFPYFVSQPGERAELPSGRSSDCGQLVLNQYSANHLVFISGDPANGQAGCGEVLVRQPEDEDGGVSSTALHFWFNGLNPTTLKVVQTIISSSSFGTSPNAKPASTFTCDDA